MLILLLILSIFISTADAVILLRLVEEIHLPARTRTWDVQHVEDSTSFGWAAQTYGETIWGTDSLFNDSLIALAVDTFYYQTRTDGNQEQYLFSREEFNPWEDVSWAGLTLFSFPGHAGPCVVVRSYHNFDQIHNLYYFDLQGDSVITHTTLFEEYLETHYYLRQIDVWPSLPNQSQWIVVAGTERSSEEFMGGCYVDRYIAHGFVYSFPPARIYSEYYSGLSIFNRSSPFSMAFSRETRVLRSPGCSGTSYQNCVIGTIENSEAFSATPLDTSEFLGRVTAQQDFNGTRRILYSNGNCYNAESGEILFNNPEIVTASFAATIRLAPGEDFLSYKNSHFNIYDGRTGEFVDSTTQIEGTPVKKLIGTGFDELLTFDNATKIVRIYKPFGPELTILPTETGQLILTWTEAPGATSYKLDRASDANFTNFVSDFLSPDSNTTTISPTATTEFFRVTPLFE
jgi:hypothetical protein